MQITQFLVGASFAMAHSFVSYTVPFDVAETTGNQAATVASASAAASESSLVDQVKNVLGSFFGASSNTPSETPQVNHGQATVPCITTTGATFAIWLNVLYLAPLTYLFVKFFITSYLRRSSAESRRVKTAAKVDSERARRASNVLLAEKAGWDAAKDLEKEVYGENGAPTTNGKHAANGKVARANGIANGGRRR
jgi:hypothetical protein